MKLTVCFFLVLLTSTAKPNSYLLRGEVKDQNGQPIAFVNIGYVGTTIGTVSNLKGEFILNLSELPDETSPLRFSCVGFEPISIYIKPLALTEKIQVVLYEQTNMLDVVVIKPEKFKEKTFGNSSETTKIKTNLAINKEPNMNLGAEVGRKFWFSDKPHFIKTMRIYIAYNTFDTLKVQLNFYELDNLKPGNILHSKPIIREITQVKQGWVSFDLIEENLVISGKCVASVAWVGASQKGNAFGMNISMPAPLQTHFYKYGAQNKWRIFPNMSTTMELVADIPQ